MSFEPAPDILQSPPTRGHGVRRLNRVPLLIAMTILLMLLGVVAYTYHQRLASQGQGESKTNDPSSAVGGLPLNSANGYIPAKLPVGSPLPEPLQPQQPPVVVEPAPSIIDPTKQAWEIYHQRLEALRQLREQEQLNAQHANTQINTGASARPQQTAATPAPQSLSEQFASLAAQRLKRLDEFGNADRDLNRAPDKRAFLEGTPQSLATNTLQARREDPITPYQISAGTLIQATLVGGVNSDLPGQLLAQVSENVYDTATGHFVLIPQGAKLIGVYDNSVTTGQERVLVAWTRIIYPDASSLDLGKMPGSDQSGFAGLHDKVDDHFWKTFGNAIFLSAISSGVQLSQGNGNNQTSGLNTQQTIAASLGQQLGQLGQEMARRNMQVQPTLEIRPGYPFTVTVTKDLILRPWIIKMARRQP